MGLNFPKLEKEILEFWKNNRIFEKSILQRKKAPEFVFYEGPPTANGKPGIHHVLSRVFKDIICRYKTMRGFRVLRKAGWDTHGLPVELEIEKKLGLKNKKDIENYGIAEFNKLCKQSVWKYLQDWEKLTERIAFWLDMENPYITYENNYMETVWWIIKEVYKKGLLYQGYKVVPYCPRCGTVLSSHEVALGYKTIQENSIYIKLSLKNQPNTYLLVWTTTPWTLPGNVAVAVNPDFTYLKVKVGKEYLILAKERLNVLDGNYEIIDEFKGKDLLGMVYEPLYKFTKPDRKSWFVIAGDFVSLKEGTGLVHIAPAFGEEDMEVGKENNLPVLLNVGEDGKFKREVKKWQGLFVKEADPLIIEDLKKRQMLFKEEICEHEYPFCWRCDSPLLYYAKQSWFIKMQKLKKDLVANNRKINWIPSHLKEGRFGEWLKEVKDWAFSRERYWGTPLPVWKCQKCNNLEVIGGKRDLLSQKFSTNQYYILRHGQTIYQTQRKKKKMYEWPEKKPVLLTKNGENQAKKAAKELRKKKIDLIYSSDIFRAHQTAEIVAKDLGVKVIFDKRLRDINLGIYHGGSKENFYRHFSPPERFYKKPPKGETWNDCKKRMLSILKEIDRKHKNKNILIVSHGDPLWLLNGAVNGLTKKELLNQIFAGKTYLKTGEWRKIDFKNFPYNPDGELDFHRPYIDEVKLYCPLCKTALMTRVPEVIDCWFDSGSMPFAQYHYPFEGKIQFPADYICEAIDQTRGWFYTLLAISTLLGRGPCYKNVISLGHVLDEKGEKMSKSKGNVVDPWYIVEKYSADAARWYFYTVNQPGDSKLFSEKDVSGALKRFILIFWNCYLFFETYKENQKSKIKSQKTKNILDKWVISRLNEVIWETIKKLDKYDVTGAARVIENFVINDLSLWYIRRSRKRFKEAAGTLSLVLLTLSKLTAPFIPFLSEEIYKKIKNLKTELPQEAKVKKRMKFSSPFKIQNSVHLEDWPKADKKLINKKLNKEMEKTREVVTLALAERAKAGIKVRQPLLKLEIPKKINKELLDLIKEEVNVKQIIFGKTLKLDTMITPELKEEGMIREVIRNIQEMRKKAALKPRDKILVRYSAAENLNKILTKNKNFILREAKVKNLILGQKTKEVFDAEKEIVLEGQNLWLAIKKI